MLTIPQAAREIGMTRAALWRHVKKGSIPVVDAGPYQLIDAADPAAFQATERKPGWPKGKPRRPKSAAD